MNTCFVYRLFIVGLLWFVSPNIFCQNDTLKGIQKLKQLINDEKIEAANKELQSQIAHFKSLKITIHSQPIFHLLVVISYQIKTEILLYTKL